MTNFLADNPDGLTQGQVDYNFSTLAGRLRVLEASDTVIRVTSTDDVTTELQEAIDAAGDNVAIVFDTPHCYLYGLDVNKTSLQIHAAQECELRVPSQTIDPAHQNPVTNYQIFFNGIESVTVRGPLIIDHSEVSYVRPQPVSQHAGIHYSWYCRCDNGRVFDVQGVTQRNSSVGGIRIQNATLAARGYTQVILRDLQSENAPAICWVRGAHQHVLIDGVVAEDPEVKSVWHVSGGTGQISVTSEVSIVPDHTESVTVRNVSMKYGLTGCTVQQGCKHFVFENITCNYYGYAYDEATDTLTPASYNGGPVMKVDNVFWQPHDNGVARSSVIRGVVTRNTSREGGQFLSLWVGQAGDQDLTFEDCKFDSVVKMVGIGAPDRPGNEGWARFGTLRNCSFYGEVQGISAFATAENCKFFAPTIADPTVSTSQEDDIADAMQNYSQTTATQILLRLRNTTLFYDCKFYGGRILCDAGTADGSLLDNCEFYNGCIILTGNPYTGTLTVRDCHNVSIRSSTPTVTATKIINVIDSTGTFNVHYNGPWGEWNDITVNRYSSDAV